MHRVHTLLKAGLLAGIVLLCPSALLAQNTEAEFEELRAKEVQRYRTVAEASARSIAAARTIDVSYYKLDVRVSSTRGFLQGNTTIGATTLAASISTVNFDLSNVMAVDSVFVDGVSAVRMHTGNVLTITLPRSYGQNERLTAVVYYKGFPGTTGFGSYTDSLRSDGKRWIFTLSEPYGSRDWWPCIDHPTDKADSVDIWITCPAGYIGVSQGKLIDAATNNDGSTTYKWKHRYPIATYLVSVTIGAFNTFSDWFRYSTTDSMEVVNYVQPDIGARNSQYRTNTAKTPRMLEIFTNLFGPYPFIKEKYGHAEFGWSGGMEHQTVTSLGYNAFSEGTIAHELAHQWFGDLITCRTWPDLWLNEGFATYGDALFQEMNYGVTAYRSRMNSRLTGAKNAVGTLYVQDTASVGNLFAGSRVYSKGSWVLHMLRRVVGDTAFFASLKAYTADPTLRFNTASTADLRTAFERVTGKDLGYFFTQWVFGERFPRYYHSLSSAAVGQSFLATVRIQQTTGTTNPSYFTMPVDLRFVGIGLDTTVVVTNNVADQSFQFTLRARPDSIQFDPNGWILKDVQRIAGGIDVGSGIPRVPELAQNYPNPFNPGTTVEITLPNTTYVSVKMFDVLGREVATLTEGAKIAGRYVLPWTPSGLAAGVYLCRLQADGYVRTRRVVLMK